MLYGHINWLSCVETVPYLTFVSLTPFVEERYASM